MTIILGFACGIAAATTLGFTVWVLWSVFQQRGWTGPRSLLHTLWDTDGWASTNIPTNQARQASLPGDDLSEDERRDLIMYNPRKDDDHDRA